MGRGKMEGAHLLEFRNPAGGWFIYFKEFEAREPIDMVYLTRRAEFSASHFYHSPELNAEENRRIFGKCNNPNGHCHNYTLEVSVKGQVDQRSGFVVDLKQLKEIMLREVIDVLDHRFLNK